MTTLNTPAAITLARAPLDTELGMTQIWDKNGVLRPVTVVRVDTNIVTQVRIIETDGYETAQLALDDIDASRVIRPLAGHFAKAGVEPRRHMVEIHTSLVPELTSGQELATDTLEIGQLVNATGISKGKGLAGVMKRRGFAGVGASHDAYRNHRKSGSTGACATPGRTFKDLRAADHMGHMRRTVQNPKIRGTGADKGVLLVNDAIPGPKGSVVVARTAMKGA